MNKCNHKKKGKCPVRGCDNIMAGKGKCKICGQKRYRNHCRSHFSDGQKIPRTRGRKTTKLARERRKNIFKKRDNK